MAEETKVLTEWMSTISNQLDGVNTKLDRKVDREELEVAHDRINTVAKDIKGLNKKVNYASGFVGAIASLLGLDVFLGK